MLMFNSQLVAAIVVNMNLDAPLSNVDQGVFNYFNKQQTQLFTVFSLGNQIHDKLQRLSATLNTLYG